MTIHSLLGWITWNSKWMACASVLGYFIDRFQFLGDYFSDRAYQHAPQSRRLLLTRAICTCLQQPSAYQVFGAILSAWSLTSSSFHNVLFRPARTACLIRYYHLQTFSRVVHASAYPEWHCRTESMPPLLNNSISTGTDTATTCAATTARFDGNIFRSAVFSFDLYTYRNPLYRFACLF